MQLIFLEVRLGSSTLKDPVHDEHLANDRSFIRLDRRIIYRWLQ